MRLRHVGTLATAALLMSTLLTGTSSVGAQEYPVCDQRKPTFRPPIRLGNGLGYEPSIETDSKGTIYVMAHKESLAAEGGTAAPRTASWLWRSVDDGKTFTDMAGMSGATNFAWALEGDGAVDAKDRFYYVDTWAADNHISRYSDRGAILDFWRPFVASPEPVDDRPWVAAHGDGYVYYIGNLGVGTAARGRFSVHRSTDAGQTFDPVGFTFPNSEWGFIDADPNSAYVYAYFSESGSGDMVVWVSPDRGVNWSKHVVADFGGPTSGDLGFPNIAVSPVDGTVYAEFDTNNALYLAESRDHGETWTLHNVTPFPGTYSHPWVTVAPNGMVGLLFEADPAAVSGSSGFVYGMIWSPTSDCLLDPANPESLCTGPAETYARLQNSAVPSQEHFITNEFTPDNAFVAPFENSASYIMFTKQTSGPNMDGTRFCGKIGTP